MGMYWLNLSPGKAHAKEGLESSIRSMETCHRLGDVGAPVVEGLSENTETK